MGIEKSGRVGNAPSALEEHDTNITSKKTSREGAGSRPSLLPDSGQHPNLLNLEVPRPREGPNRRFRVRQGASATPSPGAARTILVASEKGAQEGLAVVVRARKEEPAEGGNRSADLQGKERYEREASDVG